MMSRRLPRLSLVVAALAGGCSGNPTLTVQPLNEKAAFRQSFTEGYATRSPDGDYDVVLFDDPLNDSAVKDDGGKPLVSTPVRPLRHLVHVHVLWTPMVGARGNDPASTNAALNWYVWGDQQSADRDWMRYGGAGFVKVYDDGDTTEFQIQNATLKLEQSHGGMVDPVGQASLSGSFTVKMDGARVKDLLSSIDPRTGQPQTASTNDGQ